MNKLFKSTTSKEKETVQKLFKAVPKLKGPWKILLDKLSNNAPNIVSLYNEIAIINDELNASIEFLKANKEKEIIEVDNLFNENSLTINADFTKQQSLERESFFTEQTHIKNELLKITKAHKQLTSSLEKKIININKDLDEELEILNSSVKENKKNNLNKINSIYKYKENEAERITSKFNEQIEDYHQKNAQRLTQNTIRLQEEDKNLADYQEFHEKDAIYAKQNFFKTLTNLNNKINLVSNAYKELEKEIEEDFIKENERLIKSLDDEKIRIDALNDEALDLYEEEYQNIDALLDELRENHHDEELKLKNQYNRAVTATNINLHNKKEEINMSIMALEENNPNNKKEIKSLYKNLKEQEKAAIKAIETSKKEYKKAYYNEVDNYVTLYESALLERTFSEQKKNDSLELYKTLYSLYHNDIYRKIKLSKEKNTLKKQIIENYKQLEILPLESQSDLANLIYNSEISFQKLEEEYLYLSIIKEKQLVKLKSALHEHNLNKTKDRITYNYALELTTSNLTNYLLMESEKNEFVFLYKVNNLKKKRQETIASGEILKINQQKELSNLQEIHKNNTFNNILQTKIELKSLSEDLLKELNDYLIEKETLIKYHKYNDLDDQEFLQKSEKEDIYLDTILKTYKNIFKTITTDEQAIIDVFYENSLENSNLDDFIVFLKTTNNLLLLKQDIVEQVLLEFFALAEQYLENKISEFSQTKLRSYKNKVDVAFNPYIAESLILENILNSKFEKTQQNINTLKETITSLQAQIKYAKDAVLLSEKELSYLTKLENTPKNKRLTLDLTDHIEINKDLINQRYIELNSFKSELSELELELKTIKNSQKSLNRSLKRFNNQKNQSLNNVTALLESETKILWRILKRVESLKENIDTLNKNYVKTLKDLTLNHQNIVKTKKILASALTKKHKSTKELFNLIVNIKNSEMSKINLAHNNNRLKQINNEDKDLETLNKTYLKKQIKINKAIKKTDLKAKTALKKLKKKDSKDIKELQSIHLKELSENNTLLINIKKEEIDHKAHYKHLKKAFEVNKAELLVKEKETLKTNFKESLKSIQKLIKETNFNIKRLNNDTTYDKKKHFTQLNYLANKDKLARQKLFQKQTSTNANHLKQIADLKERLPRVDTEYKKLLVIKEKNEHKTAKKIKLHSAIAKFNNKIILRFVIKRRKRQLRKEFISKL